MPRVSACLTLVLGLIFATSCNRGAETTDSLDAPTGLSESNITKTSATLSWDTVTGAGSYLIRIDDGIPVTVITNYYPATGLTAGTDYTWAVQAVNGNVRSEWAESEFTTESLDLMDAPTGLTATGITDIGATLSWTLVLEATGYQLRIDDNETVDVTGTTYAATGLTPDSEHSWRVRAVSETSESLWVDETFRTIESGPVPTPTNLQVSDVVHNWALISWDPVEGASGYNIRVNGEVITGNGIFGGGSETGLTLYHPDTDYTWAIRAVNGEMQSHWAEGPAFHTPPAPYDFEDILGNYTANGVPSVYMQVFQDAPGPSNWTGQVLDTGVDNRWYTVTYAFSYEPNIPMYMGYDTGYLSLDCSQPIVTGVSLGEGVTGDIYVGAGFINPEHGGLSVIGPRVYEAYWDQTARRISFQDQIEVAQLGITVELLYGLIYNVGGRASILTDFYNDLTFNVSATRSGASGVAALPAVGKVAEITSPRAPQLEVEDAVLLFDEVERFTF